MKLAIRKESQNPYGSRRVAMSRMRRGFTLFELMTVLSIIVILASMGMLGFQSLTPPGAVGAARNEMHGLLRFAREQAIMRGSNSMLIINYDSDDREKFLRYVGVIVEEDYNSTIWKAAHSGVYLPEGVYFVPQTDVDAATDGFDFDALWPVGGDLKSIYNCTNSGSSFAIGSVEYPVLDTIVLDVSTGDPNWIGYQFGPDGRVDKVDFGVCSSGSGNENKNLILGLASYGGGDTLLFEDSDKAIGIVVRVNGVSYAVDDPSAL